MHQQLNLIIEILGTISFAMSGSFAAMQKRLDPFGVLIIAFVTSVGGGTVRDLLLDVPVFWMTDMLTCSLIFFTCVFSMVFKSIEKNFKVTLFIFDSFGLGLFTIIGIQKGINSDLHPLICLTLGTITGCFGGIIRDILLNRIPLIFRKEIYANSMHRRRRNFSADVEIYRLALYIGSDFYNNLDCSYQNISRKIPLENS